MNKIIAGLFIGSIRDSKDPQQLKANSITHILSIHDTAKPGSFEDVQYLCICAADSISQNLAPYFSRCNDFIHKARLSGGNVLIHCLAGVSRSVTIAIAYLMSITKLSYKEVLDAMRSVRPISDPNPGFYRQLHDFEKFKRKQERNRLSKKFLDYPPPINLTTVGDESAELKKLIQLYRSKGGTSKRRQTLTTTTSVGSIGNIAQNSSQKQSHNHNNFLIFYTPKVARRSTKILEF